MFSKSSVSLMAVVALVGCGGPVEHEEARHTPTESTAPAEGAAGRVSAMAWTGSVSEETAALTLATGNLVGGVECSGGYCDSIRFDALPVSATFGSTSWTSYFSDEGTNYRICGTNQWVTGLDCDGWWCDNMSLACTHISNKTPTYCHWSSTKISEETHPYHTPAGYYVRGIRCEGAYCDTLSFYICKLS